MKTFLEELAARMVQDYHSDFSRLVTIFPNKRAGLFFRKALSAEVSRPVWSPEVLNIEDFISQFTSSTLAEPLTLLLELYLVYRQETGTTESLDRFYFYGDMLLQDFDEIDKYLVDPDQVFSNLRYQKEIDRKFFLSEEQIGFITRFWSSFGPKISRQQDDFLKIWKVLPEIYRKYRQRLAEQQIAYAGMIQRNVVDKIIRQDFAPATGKIYVFAGFNALTEAEKKIISWFIENRKADVYWDTDDYYQESGFQESGMFLRHYRKDHLLGKHFKTFSTGNFKTEKEIELVECPDLISQTAKVNQMLENQFSVHSATDPSRTVVVLPDERLLFPFLDGITDLVNDFNVTMGYPVRNTIFYSFLENLLELQLKVRKDDTNLFYHKPLLFLLNHSYIHSRIGKQARDAIKTIEAENQVWIDPLNLKIEDEFILKVLTRSHTTAEMGIYLQNVLLMLRDLMHRNSSLDLDFLIHFTLHLKNLLSVVLPQSELIDLNVFIKLVRQVAGKIRLPFTGEPVAGLQIMGVMETRNLDFDQVYLLSMNEGVFPAGPSAHSFIPYNLRRGFGLPVVDQHDAIYAYLFYRLIQRAKKVVILYKSNETDPSAGELSRFVTQLIFESGHKVKRSYLNLPVGMNRQDPIIIEKDYRIRNILNDYLVVEGKSLARLTPSAISIYLDCRLKFYFRYLAKIYEAEKVKEEIDPMVFGNVLHETIENLYQQFVGKTVDKTSLKALEPVVPEVCRQVICHQFGLQENRTNFSGKLLLLQELVTRFCRRIIELDQVYAPFTIVALEKRDLIYNLDLDQDGKIVGLKGIVDRIDRKEGIVRVIDYKTGRDERTVDQLESLFDRDHKSRNKAAFQLLFYTSVLSENDKANRYQPAVFNGKELFRDDFDYKLNLKGLDGSSRRYEALEDVSKVKNQYLEGLKELLREIFVSNQPFDQTDDLRKCQWCTFSGFCHR